MAIDKLPVNLVEVREDLELVAEGIRRAQVDLRKVYVDLTKFKARCEENPSYAASYFLTTYPFAEQKLVFAKAALYGANVALVTATQRIDFPGGPNGT